MIDRQLDSPQTERRRALGRGRSQGIQHFRSRIIRRSDSVRSKLTVSDGHLIVHHPANPDEGRDRAFAHPNAWASRLIACAAAQQRIMPPSKYYKKLM